MLDMQVLLERKSQLEMSFADQQQVLQQSQMPWNAQKDQYAARFAVLKDDIKKLVVSEDLQRMRVAICERFPRELTIQNGCLALSGVIVQPIPFDRNSCFSVYNSAKSKFYEICKYFFSNWKKLPASASNGQYLNLLAACYNTFLALYNAIPRLQQEVLEVLERRMEAELEPVLTQNKMLQNQLQELEDQIRQLQAQIEEAHSKDPVYCYIRGENAYFGKAGMTQDWGAAVSWYQKAADLGHPDAQYSLGYCYYQGQGVVQDGNQAVHWFQKAAAQGHEEACYWLGQCYCDGVGVRKNRTHAVKWWQPAAEGGHPVAQYRLGLLLLESKQAAEAAIWWRKAAEQGYVPAKAMLNAYGN